MNDHLHVEEHLLKPPSEKGGLEHAKRRFAYYIIIPAFLWMLFWTVFPYLWVLALAFFDYSPRRSGGMFLGLGGENPFVGLKNFVDMFDFSVEQSKRAREFQIALKNTLLFATLVLPLNLLITLPLATLVNNIKHRTANAFFRTLFFLPVITSSVGVGIMWGYIFNPQRGILNAALSEILGKRLFIDWLHNPNLSFLGFNVALIGILVAYLWADIGYNFIIFLAALQGIPDSLIEAAKIDGASPLQRLTKVIIPLLKPQIMLVSILTVISAFQIFDLVQVMTRGGPNKLTRVMIFDIWENGFRFEDMGFASAAALVFFLIILIVSVIQKLMLKTEWEY
jgi:ABC-type sugar transport system permease subunit